MSNNGIPPLNDWQADNYPVIYDEGEDKLKYVKTGVKNNINTGGSSYLVYTALLTQTGTSAPVATVLENTLGGTVVWTRESAANYIGTLAGAFPNNKVIAFPSSAFIFDAIMIACIGREDNNSIRVITLNSSGVGAENFSAMPVVVYVYQ